MNKHALWDHTRVLRRSFLLGVTIAGVAGSTAFASTSTPTVPSSLDGTTCTPLTFSQALQSAGDSAWYTMLPGETPGHLTGSGWTLSGGASIETTTVAGGGPGQVLNLPSGATAYTPPVCINEGFQEARADVNDVRGSEGIQFYIQPWGDNGWGNAQNTGQVHNNGWALSGEMNLNNNVNGWELVRFEFQAGGNPNNPSDFQLYNFWLDPRMMD